MVRGLYTAYTGMQSQQEKLDVVSNNLANADTTAYKQDNVTFSTFKDLLATKINDPDQMDTSIGSLSLGSQVDSFYTNFEQGSLQETDDKQDMALEGQGMFVVGTLNDDGSMTTRYTRDGAFTLNQDGVLTTENGEYVLNEEGGTITLPNAEFQVNDQGQIYYDDEYVDTLQISNFEDLNDLEKIGDNLYQATDEASETDFTGTVQQGFLEASNVNSVKEMIEMMTVMRAYESGQKVMQTYDSTLDKAVNTVGRV